MGFNTLAVDHPYDATIVDYLGDNYVEYPHVTIPMRYTRHLHLELKMFAALLDAVTNRMRCQGLGIPVYYERMIIFEHSQEPATQ